MTTQTVTLIAAAVAACVSFCTLIINLRAQYRTEMRAAYRLTLERHLGPLGQNLYEIMACSKMLADKNHETGASRANWKERSERASNELRKLRLLVRYNLWGLDEPLRALTRVPNWIEHNRGKRANSSQLISFATILRKEIDESIRRAYAYGRPPSYWERHSLARKTKILREKYRSFAPEGFYDDE